MPFKSKSQQRFMFTKHPEMAKEWADKTPDISKLPEHVKKMAKGGEAVHSMSDIGNLKGLQDLMDRKAAGEDIYDAPKTDPAKADDPGTFLGEFNVGASTEPRKMADGGLVVAFEKLFGDKAKPMKADKQDASSADAIDPVIHGSTETAKGYDEGGDVLPTNGGYPGAGADNMAALQSIMGAAPNIPGLSNFMPSALTMPGLQSNVANMANSPAAAGVINGAMGQNVVPPQPPTPPTPQHQPINITGSVPPPSAPLHPMMKAAQTAQTIAPTQPGIYQGISAQDRANLMQQLIAQKSSPGMLAAKGIAGLGDAVTSAFGKQPTQALQGIRQNEQQNIEQRTGVMDTERQQKLQDLQANMTQQENDPKSAYSVGMRQFVGSFLGKAVPSGVSASMLKSSFGDIAKIFDAQVQAHSQHEQHVVESGKALQDEPIWHKWLSNIAPGLETQTAGEKALEGVAGIKAEAPAATGGWKVVR